MESMICCKIENEAGGNRASLLRPDATDDIGDPYIQDYDSDTSAPVPTLSESSGSRDGLVPTPSESSGSSDGPVPSPLESSGSRDGPVPTPLESSGASDGAPGVVHEHYSVDDVGPRSLQALLDELDAQDDDLPVLEPYVEEGDTLPIMRAESAEMAAADSMAELADTTDLGETVLPDSRTELGETVLPDSRTELGETVPDSRTELGETVPDSRTVLGETVPSRTELGETKADSRTELGETVPPDSRTELAKDDREAAIREAKQRQLRLKALLAASAQKLAQMSLF